MKLLDAITNFFESHRYRRVLFSCLVVAAVFAYLLMASWHKWGDLIVDSSREMWVPLQIMRGKVLYKDIYYFHGPLPAYIISLCYKIFGASINTLIGCGIATTIVMCVFMYMLANTFMNWFVSVILVVNYCLVFAFGVGTYDVIFNYIFPYSFASTFCLLFIAGSLLCFLQYIEFEKTAHLIGWNLLLTLAFLSRPETALPVWCAFVFSGLLIKSKRRYFRLLMLITPVFLSAMIYCIGLYWLNAFDGFKETLLGSLLFASKGKDAFVISTAGFKEVTGNILLVIQSFLYHLIVVVVLCAGSILVHKASANNKMKLLKTISGCTLIVVAIVFACNYLENTDDLLQYRCIPLILLFSIILSLLKMFHGVDYKYNHKFFTLSFIALLLTAKIILNATPILSGFYLLTIGLVVYYVYFIKLTTGICKKISPFSVGICQSLPILIVFVALAIKSWGMSADIYSGKNLRVDSGKGILYCWGDLKTKSYWDAVHYLQNHTSKNDSLVVIPEGASINFYAERSNPLKYFLFLPGDIIKIGEQTIINQLHDSKIDYIAIVHRPSHEYEFDAFGVDYGLQLSSWIAGNYEKVNQFGAKPFSSDNFGIEILKRK
ncbi:glycosyltransferase family 39 protein [Geobacter pelophilus]|uniref:Glycosyltransferase family 39 protein n=1 Tax=Geoanaerobacter pelophilus TaxID=60036 RepID=A0AAW4L971_9BACT|nr:glycosyltransferase family 39 protein [Geoanaerobacter pelophilus]MBT0663716.1 glycosyltransferase family 39 protein [Geoanaerobacter pelophilus]